MSPRRRQVNLYVSSDAARTFKKARLPFQLTEHSYTILDTSEGSVFLHVNHGDYHTGYGNIYLSDAEGLRFALSMRNNKRDAQGRCDFEKLQGIEGVYITNEQINADAESNERPRLRTKITFDKGGRWSTLKPPAQTNMGKDFACRADEDATCSLHLHGVTDSWGPFYSSKNAIGIVMATGNVGHYLSSKEDEVRARSRPRLNPAHRPRALFVACRRCTPSSRATPGSRGRWRARGRTSTSTAITARSSSRPTTGAL